jgi:hypothetical protein
MATVLQARGAGASGQQPNGIVAQYQLDGINGTPETLGSGVGPYDSGNILGTVPPGKPGVKLVKGTIQRATDLITDGTPGQPNWLASTSGVGVVPTENTAQRADAGLSLAANHE